MVLAEPLSEVNGALPWCIRMQSAGCPRPGVPSSSRQGTSAGAYGRRTNWSDVSPSHRARPPVQACPLDLAGTASVACEATGLSAALHFRPFRGGAVRGAVAALLGEGEPAVHVQHVLQGQGCLVQASAGVAAMFPVHCCLLPHGLLACLAACPPARLPTLRGVMQGRGRRLHASVPPCRAAGGGGHPGQLAGNGHGRVP